MAQNLGNELRKIVHYVNINRKDIYSSSRLKYYPSLRNNLRISLAKEMANHMDYIIYGITTMAEGETVDEAKQVKFSYEFQVFKSWTDHLKYRLVEKYPFLGKYLKVQYQKIVKYREETVPVKVVRACPHLMIDWHDKAHFAYIFPSKFEVKE